MVQRIETCCGKFLDVQGVTGSSPVPSTIKTPRVARLWEFFLCVLGRVSLIFFLIEFREVNS